MHKFGEYMLTLQVRLVCAPWSVALKLRQAWIAMSKGQLHTAGVRFPADIAIPTLLRELSVSVFSSECKYSLASLIWHRGCLCMLIPLWDLQDVPKHFLCPITQQIMSQPAVAPSGITYQLSAVCDWLHQSATDPLARTPLTKESLVPNLGLRDAIEGWLQATATKLVPVKGAAEDERVVTAGVHTFATMCQAVCFWRCTRASAKSQIAKASVFEPTVTDKLAHRLSILLCLLLPSTDSVVHEEHEVEYGIYNRHFMSC